MRKNNVNREKEDPCCDDCVYSNQTLSHCLTCFDLNTDGKAGFKPKENRHITQKR